MTTTNDPLVGTTYDGRYRVERRIGAGGMANVYLAEDITLGRRVAIKVLHQRFADDSQFVERFLREASAAARLNHPNIVQVYDRGQSDHTYYIAMEYVDGMTLKELVQRRGGLTEQEVLAYGRQALHALRFAHRNGIVHRDVKPHNMMVDTDGRLKIADFGIARAGADAGLTEAGSIVGTAQYLSPEQAQGHEVSATSDLYSLGVVMFEMATGRVPFDGESPVNVALKHVKDPVPRPSTLQPAITPQLESIVLKAMEKDPALRYQSADEMLAELDRARDGATTQAMTQVTPVVPITPVTPVYETPLAPEPAWPEAAYDDEAQEEKRSPWRWLAPLLIALAVAAAAAWILLGNSGDPVPDVSGMTLQAARIELEDAGFQIGELSEEFSDDVAKGRVIGTDPAAGDEVESGSRVDIVMSDGPQPEQVPNVVDKPVAEATNLLEEAGFVVRQGTAEAHPKIKKGNVIRQTPVAGTQLQEGETVTIIVSSGPEKSSVPSVTGMQFDEAKALLEGDEFKFVVSRTDVDSSQPAGVVVGQSPQAGAELAEGGRITLQVASGRNEVPTLEGLGQTEAEAALQEAGLEADIVTEATDDPAKIGVVLGSDPAAGQRVSVGSTVQLTVGEAAEAAVDPGDVPPV